MVLAAFSFAESTIWEYIWVVLTLVLYSDGMPFTLALTSTVRHSSMKACFTPALTMAK